MFPDAIVAHDPAAHAVADHDYVAAHWLAKNKVVKRRYAIEVCWRHTEVRGNITQALVGDPATTPLDNLQRVDANSITLWIMLRFGLDFVHFFRGQHLCKSS